MRALTWPGMPAREPLAEAGRRLSCEVDVVEIASNEDLANEMSGGRFDIVFPSDYMVERLRGERAIVPLEPGALPLDLLEDWAIDCAHDPGCRWSVPFAYGTTGVLAGPECPSTGWDALFAIDGPVLMLDEVREVFGAALIASGRDPNDLSPAALRLARRCLLGRMPLIAAFDSDDFVGPVATGQVVAAHAWSGPASGAVRANRNLRYFVPEEGAILWVTSAAIPADAPDPELSTSLLRELMDPRLAAGTTERNGYATPNREARRLLPPALDRDSSLFPDEETLKRCVTLTAQGEAEARLSEEWKTLTGAVT